MNRYNKPVTQLLVRWVNLNASHDTWEYYTVSRAQFPTFDPRGQGSCRGGGIVTVREEEVRREGRELGIIEEEIGIWSKSIEKIGMGRHIRRHMRSIVIEMPNVRFEESIVLDTKLTLGMLERDEDLLLFQELHKREKSRIATLLQPVSDEFEPTQGNFALYRISSGKKGCGYQFFSDNDKNDYNWLKTPPATPLFPSLEMEAKAAQPVVQRELPIIQPLSRFAGHGHKDSANSMPNPKPTSLKLNPPTYNGPSTQLGPESRRSKEGSQRTQILGSKMVERVMNARKSISIDESQRDAAKQKLRGETTGFARTKHLQTEIKRDSTQLGNFHRRRGQDQTRGMGKI
ncbi:hypothetical protein F3Y22_tig00110204pilonHSYRG00051 [Hibiscus syriacus]|uniref:Uncharacterized protein n=1 Tax=Hibiscus syriacus TaxID=106335 RepID=A0A6A3B9Y9_HIBSY|nr:hypothetical protein F3Y22_tig00110204pilonHSYRG00051 [Hibiscus syriacus]